MTNVSYIDNKNELAYHRVSTAPSDSEKFKFNLHRQYFTFERPKVTKILRLARGTSCTPAKRQHPCRHAVATPFRGQFCTACLAVNELKQDSRHLFYF